MAGQKNDLSIAPMTNFYIFANVFFFYKIAMKLITICRVFGETFFIFKNQRKVFGKLTFGNSEFAKQNFAFS